MRKRIIITGGHLTPALALVERLPKKDWEIIFIGRKHALEGDPGLSVEYQTARKSGLPFISLTTGRLQRKFTRYTLISLLKIPFGLIQSFYWLLKLKPSLILSFGGYVAVPVALAGWILRIPVVTHEQSVVPGLANKIIGFLAKKICVSWEKTLPFFPKNKTVLTGNPLRKEIFEVMKDKDLRLHLEGVGINLNNNLPLIYITGGNLGAHVINEAVAKILPRFLKKYRIIHQCGDSREFNDYEKLLSISRQLPAALQKRYFLAKYVGPEDIGWVFNHADLVVSRAGANIVTELLALGKISILIPLPWAGQNEQMENARILEKAGTAVILPQEKLTGESLYHCTKTIIQEIDKYQEHASEARKLVNIRAADQLLKVISNT